MALLQRGLDRLHRRGLLVETALRERHVGTGLQRHDGAERVAVLLVDRLHEQRVGDDDAVVADGLAQQAGQDGARQRGRMLRVDLRVDDVGRHHGRRRGRVTLRMRERAERAQLERLELGDRLVDRRQRVVRIHVGVAVAGEVLDAAGHAFAQRAAHPGAGQARDGVRILAEAALGDHRIARVVVDVEHRREVPVDAQAAQAARDGRADLFAQGLVVDGAQRHRGGRLRQEGGAHHRAAFLVDADQAVRAHDLAQVAGELAHLGLAAEVAAEQADRAHVVAAQELRGRGIERRARDVDHHEMARMEGNGHGAHVVGWAGKVAALNASA